MASLSVAVIGSGLTGLLVAQGLRKNGIKAVVFERDPSLTYHGRDWTLMLHWGLYNLNEILPNDVLDRFPEAFCDPFYTVERPPPLPMLNGVTGDILFHIPSMPMRLVSRKRFQRVLAHHLNIRFNKRLSRLTEHRDSVFLTFEDGTNENFDIVLGADGANSSVRRHLLGEERASPMRTPWAISLATFRFHDSDLARFSRAPHDVWQMAYAPEGIGAIAVLDSGPKNNPSEWLFSYLRIWRDDDVQPVSGAEALRKFKQKCETLCEPYRSAAAGIPDVSSSCNIDQLKYWAPVRWTTPSRRVTLAGDAAHALLPFRGQGLNVCIDDASNLISYLVRIRDGEDRGPLIGAYDRDVVERGRAAVLASLEEGMKKMDFEQVMTCKTASQGFERESLRMEELNMERRTEGQRLTATRI